MTMPQFTAEAVLSRPSRHYRTCRSWGDIHSPSPMTSAIHPARQMEEEVIHVHSCAPGWINIGGSCWPTPLTEPSSGGNTGGSGLPSGGGGGPGGGGGSGGLGSYWECMNGCDAAHSMCLDTCEGTWENPKPSRNCWICDDHYQRCVDACSRNIA